MIGDRIGPTEQIKRICSNNYAIYTEREFSSGLTDVSWLCRQNESFETIILAKY